MHSPNGRDFGQGGSNQNAMKSEYLLERQPAGTATILASTFFGLLATTSVDCLNFRENP
jgi:hypothetical protein